jgi:hypothetical protein
MSFFPDYNQKVSRHISPLDWGGLEYIYVKNDILYDPNHNKCKKVSEVNPIRNLKVNLTYPVNVLVEEFKKNIKDFQEMLQIETENTQTHNHLEYLVSCLKKLNLKDNEIIERLLDNDLKNLNYDDGKRKAGNEKIRRVIKDLEKV